MIGLVDGSLADEAVAVAVPDDDSRRLLLRCTPPYSSRGEADWPQLLLSFEHCFWADCRRCHFCCYCYYGGWKAADVDRRAKCGDVGGVRQCRLADIYIYISRFKIQLRRFGRVLHVIFVEVSPVVVGCLVAQVSHGR